MAASRTQQVSKLIRFVGDLVSESGRPVPRLLLLAIRKAIDTPSNDIADSLAADLVADGVMKMTKDRSYGEVVFLDVDLTIEGWERYERQKRGQVSGNQGFMAMKFGDPCLDSFAREVVKPAVESMGYRLFDMRDVARAGVIDNIMRIQIKDSAFLIADLTHDNAGAYWEAGYAEGLGKPVIYICERSKFEEKPSHFDTNHCTTVFFVVRRKPRCVQARTGCNPAPVARSG